jgi:hypothetical protein
MRLAMLTGVLIFLGAVAQAVPQQGAQPTTPTPQPAAAQAGAGARKIPCKVPENASMCYWTRGRLSFYPIGQPSYRMWKVGTKRILGIYSGPAGYPLPIDSNSSYPEFPASLERVYELETARNTTLGIDDPWLIGHVFADFEVCPLEPEKPGYMQPSCIESAKNMFVSLSKRGYR